MKLKTLSPRRKQTAISFAALLSTAAIPLFALANTELDVPLTATTLNGVSGIGATSDVTLTNGTYTNTTLTTTALSIGTLNDLDTTQALSIKNPTGTNTTLTLAGGTDTVAGSSAGDLLYIATGANLTISSNTSNTLGLVLGASGNFDIAGTGTATISSVISGTAPVTTPPTPPYSVTKTGTGTLTLSGANTFGGAGTTFRLSAGTLNINNASALGSASNNLLLQGGTIDNTSAAAIATAAYSSVISSNLTFAGTQSLALGTAASTDVLGGNVTVTTNANALSLGSLVGNFALTKAGSGTLTLLAAPVNSGGMNISAGTLNFASATSFTYAAPISGTGSLANSGGTTLTLTGANTYSGSTNINNGTIAVASLGNANVAGGLGTSGTINLGSTTSSGTLLYNGAATTSTDRVINLAGTTGGGTLDSSGQGAITYTSNTTATGAGSKTLTLQGSNVFANTFAGAIGNSAGTIGTTSTFASGVTSITVASGTGLGVGAAISGTGITPGTIITGISGTTVTLSQATNAAGTASALTATSVTNLTKTGSGTWFLSGANTYSGVTTVSGGILNIAGEASLGTTPAAPITDLVFSGTSTLQLASAAGNVSLSNNRNVSIGSGFIGTFDTNGAGNGLTINGIIGGAGSLTKTGAGTLTLTGANTYTGNTLITSGGSSAAATGFTPGLSTVVVSGAGTLGGSANPATTSVTVSAGSTLTLDYTGNNTADRIGNLEALTLGSGTLNILGNASANTSETVGAITFGRGGDYVNLTPGTGQLVTLTGASYARSAGSVAAFTGPNLGASATVGSQVKFTAAPTISGLGTTNATILLGAYGVDTAGTNSPTFVTYDANGVRLLAAGEQASDFSTAISTTNVKLSLAGAGTTSIASGIASVQSLQIDNTVAGSTTTAATVTNSTTAGTFQPTSGLLFTGNNPITLSGAALAETTSGEMVIMSTNTAGVTINTSVGTGTATGLNTFTVGGSGNVTLSGGTINMTTTSSAGNFNYVGTGTLRLGDGLGSNNTGSLNIYSGTVQAIPGFSLSLSNNIGIAAGATFDTNGINIAQIRLNDLSSGGGTLTNTSATQSVFTVGPFFASSFSGSITGNIQMFINGGNNATSLLGNNSFTGGMVLGAVGTSSYLRVLGDSSLGAATGKVTGTSDNIVFSTAGSNGGVYTIATTTINPTRTMGIGPTTTGTAAYTGGLGTAAGTTLTYNGVIQGTTNASGVAISPSGTANLVINDVNSTTAGTVVLGGANTYNGSTTVYGGTLSVNSIGNVGGSSPTAVGMPTTVANGTISLGPVIVVSSGNQYVPAGLQYTGGTTSTDRVINMAGTTNGATLDASGSGTITFASNLTATGAGPKALTLQGSSSGILGGAVPDSAAATTLNGTTTPSAAYASGASSITLNNASQIAVGSTISGTGITAGTTVTAVSGTTVTLSANTTAAGTTSNSVTFGTFASGASTVTLASVANVGVGAAISGSGLAPNTTITAISGNVVTLSTATTSTVSTGTGENFTGVTSLSKTGLGTWTLNGANTYTGSTSVTGGTLTLNGTGAYIGATTVSGNGSTLVAGANSALGATSGITVNNGGTLLLSNTIATNRIANNTAISLGGTFGRGGTGNITEGTGATAVGGAITGASTQGMGLLTLTSNSNLDFGTGGVATFVFSDLTANGHVLNIVNYSNSHYAGSLDTGTSGIDGADDRLIFLNDQTLNLANFTFNGLPATEIYLDTDNSTYGYVEIVPLASTAVPEPGTWAAGLLALGALLGAKRRWLFGMIRPQA